MKNYTSHLMGNSVPLPDKIHTGKLVILKNYIETETLISGQLTVSHSEEKGKVKPNIYAKWNKK